MCNVDGCFCVFFFFFIFDHVQTLGLIHETFVNIIEQRLVKYYNGSASKFFVISLPKRKENLLRTIYTWLGAGVNFFHTTDALKI